MLSVITEFEVSKKFNFRNKLSEMKKMENELNLRLKEVIEGEEKLAKFQIEKVSFHKDQELFLEKENI